MQTGQHPLPQMSPYDILFEPLAIGPVTAPNRFYQVPHCNGLGHGRPRAEAAHRAIKAEGGWGVVSTQEVEIHPSAEISPFLEGRLWDDKDLPVHQLIVDSIHQHGSLAAIELVHMGHHTANNTSRIPPLSVRHTPVDSLDPVNARAMSRADITALRNWHVAAAKRSVRAGYDIVYVYAGHDMSVLMHFLQARINNRSDEYGGSVINRIRIVREILEAVKDAVGDKAAVAFRCAVDELMGAEGIQANSDGAEIVSELSELPDLWDVNVSNWSNDSATARFEPEEGYQLPYTSFVKTLTSKPVVGVGRFTSADKMASLIKNGTLDFIGAARPSIADPFLPEKIRSGQIDKIRECIGCNICVSSDNVVAPIRCTQNPTAGEEWRRQWHPEHTTNTSDPQEILIVGAGPAGLECALQLMNQGHKILLAEKTSEAGGRSILESRMPGLSSYKRVADYRLGLLTQSSDVQLLLENDLQATDIMELGLTHVCVATGAQWCRQGFGRNQAAGVDMATASVPINTADDVLKQSEKNQNKINLKNISGEHVLIYDDDHYYMGGVVAEFFQQAGCKVTLATSESIVSAWTVHTLEQHKIQSRLVTLSINILANKILKKVAADKAILQCQYGGQDIEQQVDRIILVTSRLPDTSLYDELLKLNDKAQSIQTLESIGDCLAPSTMAAAVYQGHKFAREFDKANSIDRYAGAYEREFVSV